MKRTLLIITALFLSLALRAQTNPIDALFEKYQDQEGFTSVFISGKMFGMMAKMAENEGDKDNPIPKISSIRILTQDSASSLKLNFYNEIAKKVDFSAYEELMVVRENREVTKFLVKKNGNSVTELLLISGGEHNNTLISIKGDIDLRQLSELSRTTGIEELEKLDDSQNKK
jgi:hypothetical protein